MSCNSLLLLLLAEAVLALAREVGSENLVLDRLSLVIDHIRKHNPDADVTACERELKGGRRP